MTTKNFYFPFPFPFPFPFLIPFTGIRRVSESPQFRQMQTVMRNQSTKLRDLRERLNRYEPENMKEQEDDD